MKPFTFLLFLALAIMAESTPRFLKGGADDGPCVATGAVCVDDDNCCVASNVCTTKAYSTTCRRFFRRGGDCSKTPANACCKVTSVCKACKGLGGQCVSDDDCCGQNDCKYATTTSAYGKCVVDDSP